MHEKNLINGRETATIWKFNAQNFRTYFNSDRPYFMRREWRSMSYSPGSESHFLMTSTTKFPDKI